LRERIDTFCARLILLIVLFILVWGPLDFAGMSPDGFLVIQGATVAALAVWIVRFWAQRPFRLLWPPMCWAALAFFLYAMIRCRLVEVEYAGRQQWIHALVYGALFFVTLNNLNHKNSAAIVSMTLIATGFTLAMLAVFQYATHYPFIWGVRRMDQYLSRGSGTFVNPDHLAGFLGMIVPLALAYTILSRFSATVKVLLAYSAVTMLAGIIVSVSRGGIVAAVLALVVFCAVLLAHRDFWRQALVMLCSLIALGAVAASQFESVHKRFDVAFKQDKIGHERRFYWLAAWQLFERAPVWGIGPGHFDVEFPSVRPLPVQNRPQYAHNDYLNTLCEWGAVGMGLIAAACGLLYWGVFQFWRSLRKPSHETGARFSDRTAFIFGAAIGLLAVMLHCIVEFNMQIAAEAVTAVTLMALLAAHERFATEQYWRNPGRPGKILLTALAASAIGYLSAQGARKGTETYWLGKANAEDKQSECAIAFATKANETEPMNWETDYTLGDYLWRLSLQDGPDYLDRAKQAMTWYAKAMQLNRFDAYAPIGCGMSMDRLGRAREATPYFEMAHQRDPHNTEIALQEARHSLELGDFTAADHWYREALSVSATDVAIAEAERFWANLADPLFLAMTNLNKTNISVVGTKPSAK
jgi:O-antigen ligase